MNGVGLVFAGGGGKGAYQIGVWKALREVGLDNKVTAVSESSVWFPQQPMKGSAVIILVSLWWISISVKWLLIKEHYISTPKNP